MTQFHNADSNITRPLRAQKVNKHQGQQFYRVPVRVLLNNSTTLATAVRIVEVIARNAAEAANLVRDEYGSRPETEIQAYGPRGGKVCRYVGWESAIANELLRS